jgi:hypothetical protein
MYLLWNPAAFVNAGLISPNSTEASGKFAVHSHTFDMLRETNEQRYVGLGINA